MFARADDGLESLLEQPSPHKVTSKMIPNTAPAGAGKSLFGLPDGCRVVGIFSARPAFNPSDACVIPGPPFCRKYDVNIIVVALKSYLGWTLELQLRMRILPDVPEPIANQPSTSLILSLR